MKQVFIVIPTIYYNRLLLCYDSLIACNMQAIADDELTNIIRRVACFGLELLKLDIRQESTRHTEVLSAITEYLQLDNYGQKDENQRQAFLLAELSNPRPLLPRQLQATKLMPLFIVPRYKKPLLLLTLLPNNQAVRWVLM
jgi:phosphoenolpyruvate carboxylase